MKSDLNFVFSGIDKFHVPHKIFMTGGHANLSSGSVYNPFIDAEMLDAGVKQKNHRSLSNSTSKFN